MCRVDVCIEQRYINLQFNVVQKVNVIKVQGQYCFDERFQNKD